MLWAQALRVEPLTARGLHRCPGGGEQLGIVNVIFGRSGDVLGIAQQGI
ncbi:hypothetical protein [Pseudophaeobacter flagellatus]|nr:hypothetical protein [Pseudophaeobacter flagellatus]MCD9146589.1 hypothetical protein [Pseudophaeobacter flagellatus]